MHWHTTNYTWLDQSPIFRMTTMKKSSNKTCQEHDFLLKVHSRSAWVWGQNHKVDHQSLRIGNSPCLHRSGSESSRSRWFLSLIHVDFEDLISVKITVATSKQRIKYCDAYCTKSIFHTIWSMWSFLSSPVVFPFSYIRITVAPSCHLQDLGQRVDVHSQRHGTITLEPEGTKARIQCCW